MDDLRPLAFLGISLIIPIVLILLNETRRLIFWICFTVGINLFDTTIGVNLLATRLTGLLLLPKTLDRLPKALKSRGGRALLALAAYSALLGVLFGHVAPWPNQGYERAFNQTAEGRTTIYVLRLIADFSVALFVAQWVANTRRIDLIIRYLVVGTTTAALGVLLQTISHVDIYYHLTGLSQDLMSIGRARGLNYEPRGAGLIIANGLVLVLLLCSQRRSRMLDGLLLIHTIAFFFCIATSSIVTLSAGTITLFYLSGKRIYSIALRFVVLGIIIALTATYILTDFATTWSANMTERLEKTDVLLSSDWIENIAFRFDFFDGPAFIFLARNPFYLIVGTGPGLVGLPATDYLPSLASYDWLRRYGLNNVPTMGWLLELSNTGLIGLALWGSFGLSSLKAFRFLARCYPSQRHTWQLGAMVFILGLVMYLVQASTASAIWAIFVGMGLGACDLAGQETSI